MEQANSELMSRPASVFDKTGQSFEKFINAGAA